VSLWVVITAHVTLALSVSCGYTVLNIIPANARATYVARASAGIILSEGSAFCGWAS